MRLTSKTIDWHNVLPLVAVTFVLAALFIAAQSAGNPPTARSDSYTPLRDYEVISDDETGCEYIQRETNGGITPRIATDGTTHKGCRADDQVSQR